MTEKIKKIIEELLSQMGFKEFVIEVREKGENEPTVFAIQINEASLLIGEHGQTLRALEQITKIFATKKIGEYSSFVLDINNYRKDRENYLKELARSIAQRVAIEKRPFKLPPMSAFERKIIHSELATRPDIITESQGEGSERKVIVKPYL
jgi:spoIIIJ-associated protein